jgi:hypothetical protein
MLSAIVPFTQGRVGVGIVAVAVVDTVEVVELVVGVGIVAVAVADTVDVAELVVGDGGAFHDGRRQASSATGVCVLVVSTLRLGPKTVTTR